MGFNNKNQKVFSDGSTLRRKKVVRDPSKDFLHIYGQVTPRSPVRIVGTYDALVKLQALIGKVVRFSRLYRSFGFASSFENYNAFCRDGVGYSIGVDVVVPDGSDIDLPYFSSL